MRFLPCLLFVFSVLVSASATSQTCTSSPCPSHAINADFTIIVDVSSAVGGQYEFLQLQTFLANFTAGLTFSPEDSQIALYTYSLYTKTYTTLNNGSDPANVQKAIQSMTFDKSNDRQLFQALSREENEVTKANGLRDGYKRILIVISADRWTGTSVIGSSVLTKVQKKYDMVMAVGLGFNSVKNQGDVLPQFTGNNDYVFFAANINQLPYVGQWLYNYACPGTHMTTTTVGPSTVPTPAPSVPCSLSTLNYDVYLIVDISSSMSSSDFEAMKQSLINFVKPFPVGDGKTQFAMFGCSIDSELYYTGFHQGQTMSSLISTISTLTQDGSSGQALELSLEAIDKAYLSRNYQTSNKLVVYVTGTANFDVSPNNEMKQLSQKYGLKAVAVQWTAGAAISNLQGFAGGSDCVNAATTSTQRNNVAAWLQTKMCGKKFCY
ncbi:unnamed protein product [Auanema sp. JU1783]|nr:unnamed protein product [Auanema sp. JU1783]